MLLNSTQNPKTVPSTKQRRQNKNHTTAGKTSFFFSNGNVSIKKRFRAIRIVSKRN